MKSDSSLQHDVLEEFAWDPMIDHAHIGVTAENGIVTLTGHVPDYTQKLAAEKAARRVMGVRAIAEEIEVRFLGEPQSADSEIAQRILSMLSWSVAVPHDKLSLKVEHGWVTLSGKVEWNYQKTAAHRTAGAIAGVKGVSNQIEVEESASAFDVRDRIMSAFKRSSAVDANAINVAVSGGTVKLSGQAHGWNERKDAENAAWSARGVTDVQDNIVLV